MMAHSLRLSLKINDLRGNFHEMQHIVAASR